MGAVCVGIYPTLTAEQTAYILAHSESRAVFVEDVSQLEKVRSVRAELPSLQLIVLFE